MIAQDGPEASTGSAPRWITAALRSARGDAIGLVAIYTSILYRSRDPDVCVLARRHLSTQAAHVRQLGFVVSAQDRSWQSLIRRGMGWATGTAAAVLGPKTVYAALEMAGKTFDVNCQRKLSRLKRDSAHADIALLFQRLLLANGRHLDEIASAAGLMQLSRFGSLSPNPQPDA